MKAIWTGAIGFGLVNIPIKLYSAVHGSELDLDMLDKTDQANIRFKRVNENTGKEVTWDNIVRGYKIDEKYVILTDEDFKKASPEKSKVIEIAEFINETDIDSIYYDTPYYLEPEKSGGKAYALLRDALAKTKKAALGTFVMRNREDLCIIKPSQNILVLNKIRFKQEIRSTEELNVPTAEAKPAEINMAIQLIDSLSGKFDIGKYKDTYSDELMKLIQAKAKGKKLATPQMKVVHSNAKDLMSQLKASLQKNTKKAS